MNPKKLMHAAALRIDVTLIAVFCAAVVNPALAATYTSYCQMLWMTPETQAAIFFTPSTN